MPEAIAYLDPGADITCEATVALTGGRLVGVPTAVNPGGAAGISDLGDGLPKVGLPAAANGAAALGVASHDCAIGGRVNVMRAPKVVPIECSAAIAIGAEVMANAAGDGRIITYAGGAGVIPIGRNIGAATTAAGQFAKVLLYASGSVT